MLHTLQDLSILVIGLFDSAVMSAFKRNAAAIVTAGRRCKVSGARSPGKQCYAVAPNIRGFSMRILLLVTVLTPRIFRWRLDLAKVCVPLQ